MDHTARRVRRRWLACFLLLIWVGLAGASSTRDRCLAEHHVQQMSLADPRMADILRKLPPRERQLMLDSLVNRVLATQMDTLRRQGGPDVCPDRSRGRYESPGEACGSPVRLASSRDTRPPCVPQASPAGQLGTATLPTVVRGGACGPVDVVGHDVRCHEGAP
jgi:hypothetical protein